MTQYGIHNTMPNTHKYRQHILTNRIRRNSHALSCRNIIASPEKSIAHTVEIRKISCLIRAEYELNMRNIDTMPSMLK